MQVWWNTDDQEDAVTISKYLNKRVKDSKADLRAFVVVLDRGKGKSQAESLAKASGADAIGTTFIKYGEAGSANYKINTAKEVRNTIFVYKNKKVSTKFVNFKADEAGMKALASAIDGIEN